MEQGYSDICPKCSGLFRKGRLKKIIGKYTDGNGNTVSGVYRCQKCSYTTIFYDTLKPKSKSNLQEDKQEVKKSANASYWAAKLQPIKHESADPTHSFINTKPNRQVSKKWLRTSAPIEIYMTDGTKSNFNQDTNDVYLSTNPVKPTITENKNIVINWSKIIGYEDIKNVISASLNTLSKKKTHILIIGSAGTSKTVFLKVLGR